VPAYIVNHVRQRSKGSEELAERVLRYDQRVALIEYRAQSGFILDSELASAKLVGQCRDQVRDVDQDL